MGGNRGARPAPLPLIFGPKPRAAGPRCKKKKKTRKGQTFFIPHPPPNIISWFESATLKTNNLEENCESTEPLTSRSDGERMRKRHPHTSNWIFQHYGQFWKSEWCATIHQGITTHCLLSGYESLWRAKIDQCNIVPWYPVWSSVGPVFCVPVGPLFSVQSNSSPSGKLIHSQNPPSKLHVPGDTQDELFSIILTNLLRTVKVKTWIASTWFSFQFLVNSHVLKLGDIVQFLSVTRSVDKGDVVDRNVTLIWFADSSRENYLKL